MSPPDLARDAPVFNIAHPSQVIICPTFWNDPDTAFFNRGDGWISQRLDLDEPLWRQIGLDDGLASITLSYSHLMVFDLDQVATFF